MMSNIVRAEHGIRLRRVLPPPKTVTFNHCEAIPDCPVCHAPLHLALSEVRVKICVCRACGTTLSVPDEAWLEAIVREGKKRELPSI